jgi:hypothetical protein
MKAVCIRTTKACYILRNYASIQLKTFIFSFICKHEELNNLQRIKVWLVYMGVELDLSYQEII